MSNVRVDQVNRARISEQIVQEEHKKQIKLFTHSRYEEQRQTFAGIGKTDLSAITTSSGNKGKEAKAGEDAVDEADDAISL